MTDVNELEKGMKLTLRELEARQNAPSNASKTQRNIALKDFCDNANEQLKKLKVDANNAKASFIDCLEHFGEDSKTLDANAFFAILVRFCASGKTAEVENVKREKLKKAQEAQKAQQENNNQGNQMNNSMNNKNQANLPGSCCSWSCSSGYPDCCSPAEPFAPPGPSSTSPSSHSPPQPSSRWRRI